MRHRRGRRGARVLRRARAPTVAPGAADSVRPVDFPCTRHRAFSLTGATPKGNGVARREIRAHYAQSAY